MRKHTGIAVLLFLASTSAAVAQSQTVRQSGVVTPKHVACWTTNGVLQDCGTAVEGFLTSLGVTAQGPGICQNSGPITGPFNRICLGVSSTSNATISLQNYNGQAPKGLDIIVNGNVVTIPPTPPSGAINVLNAGAAGDCVTDDWPVIQGLIDQQSAAGGGALVFPPVPVCYRVAQAVRAKNGVKIFAHGATIRGTGDSTAMGGCAVRFPTGGVFLAGTWTGDDIQAATKYSLNAIATNAFTITFATPAQTAFFNVGDVVLVGTSTTFTVPGVDAPTALIPNYAQMNVVESIDSGTGTVTLRHPVDSAYASPIVINLSNSGLPWYVNPKAPGCAAPMGTQWAVRDFAIYGGKWVSDADLFFLVGGLIDSTIAVESIQAQVGGYYGNLGAYNTFVIDYGVGSRGGIEIALLSHNNTVTMNSLSLAPYTCPGASPCVRSIWGNEGSRQNTVTINKLNAGAQAIDALIQFNQSWGNSVTVQNAYAQSTSNTINIVDQAVTAGTPPATSNNTIEIGTASVGTAATTYYTYNNGYASNNWVKNSRFIGSSVAAIAFDSNNIGSQGVTGDRISDSYFSDGEIQRGAIAPLQVSVSNTYVADGLASIAPSYMSGMAVSGLTTTASSAPYSAIPLVSDLSASNKMSIDYSFGELDFNQSSSGPSFRWALANDGKLYLQRSADGTFGDGIQVMNSETTGAINFAQGINANGNPGLTTTVVVACGTLQFAYGVLIDKGTC